MGNMYDLFGNYRTAVPAGDVSVKAVRGALEVQTPYHPALVASIKGLPSNCRRYDATRKIWQVSPEYGEQIKKWIWECFHEQVDIEESEIAAGALETRILKCHYLGRTKARGGDDREAFGMDEKGGWSFVFPEKVLREWFAMGDNPNNKPTLYGVLGIKRNAGAGEIKTAYRRMALQWHPDHCREDNAHETFLAIKRAYEILSDENKRGRYDAGLTLERSLSIDPKVTQRPEDEYRTPLRCGLVMAEGREQLGRFWVEKILAWQDIYNQAGQMLVVSWLYGEDKPQERWV